MAIVIMAVTGCGGSGADASDVPAEDPIATLTAPDDAAGIDEAEVPGAIGFAPTTIPVTTYDGSGELVHPDVAYFPRGWQGVRYWFAATPYPNGDANYENPSIFEGSTSGEMRVPTGATNPLARPEPYSYLSDPDVVMDPVRKELRMYYRQTLPTGDQIHLVKSTNGVTWSKSQLVLGGERYGLISPAIVREQSGTWRMWTVNAVGPGCRSMTNSLTLQQRRSSDGVSWGAPEPVNLTIPKRVPWHWDVQYVKARHEYWAMVAAYPDGTNCSLTALYFARSSDGTNWNVSPYPLLRAGDFPPIRELVYRSSFRYHEGSDAVSVWYSGARLEEGRFNYSVALARYTMEELLHRVNGESTGAHDRSRRERPSAQLQAARAAFVADFP